MEHVDDRKRRHRVSAFQCQETHDGKLAASPDLPTGRSPTRTSRPWEIAADVAAGKSKTKGFNLQKNGGFNLEHAYSTGQLQIKNFYVLLQIAHRILQLTERGILLTQNAGKFFGSLANLARRLAESIRNVLIAANSTDPANATKI